MTSSARSIPLVKVPYSLLTFWWFLFPSVHSSSLSLWKRRLSRKTNGPPRRRNTTTRRRTTTTTTTTTQRGRRRGRERGKKRESWNVTTREKKSEKQTTPKKKPKKGTNKEKNLIEEKIGFFLFCLFSLSLSFLSFFLSRDASWLTFTRVHTVLTYFNRTYIFHFEREREGERGRKNLRGGEL